MKLTIDTDQDTYAQAIHRLRSAYSTGGRLPPDHGRPRPPYVGKLVLEPLPPICPEPGRGA